MATPKYQTLDRTDALPTEYLLGDQLPRIPRGDVTLLFGDGAIGKGRLTAWCIKQVTADGGTVIVILPEDHPNEQVRPRLEAAGLTEDEMSRVINLTRVGSGRFKISADTTHDGSLPLLRDEILPALASRGHDVRLVVFDPLAAVVGWGSIQSNAGARRAVEPIQDLCMDTGISALVVAHTVKSGQLQGSAGLLQAVRLCYRVSKDRNNPSVRVLSVEKGNNLPAQEDLRFEIIDDGNGNAKVVFLTPEEIERRQREWRTPVYKAVMVIKQGGVTVEERQLGRFTDLTEAQATAAAQPECPGPALDWTQHVNHDGTVNMRTISAGFQKEDTLYAFAIRSTLPMTATRPTAQPTAQQPKRNVKASCEHPWRNGPGICGNCPRRIATA